LPGPKLRVGELPGGVVELEHGHSITLHTRDEPGHAGSIPISWPGLTKALSKDDEVYLADGSIRLRVCEVGDEDVECEIEVGGPLSSHKGVNLPGATEGLPAVGANDLGWVEFGVKYGIDIFAVSFVRSAADLNPVKERLAALGVDRPIIAKIEKPQAAENAEEIIKAVDGGIMVARGDLGIEVPISRVPILQKRLIRLAGRHSRPSITATQMMASMVSSSRPTRAEVTDVANAIFDGTDAIMLSEETAVGANPVEAVAVMDRIARQTEPDLPYGDWLIGRTEQEDQDVSEAVAQSAVASTYRLGLTALVVPTSSGRTARLVSAHRPEVPVLAISPRIETVRRLQLLFGVTAVLSDQTGEIRGLLDDCAALAGREGVARTGDLVGITAGLPNQDLGTNLFEVHRVP
ncbi:MAG TPA: pyruvate kinase, partial [Solirubrobacterales bacterium]|nr:pyruvate kinase [Solirubrobacterales bacterium]